MEPKDFLIAAGIIVTLTLGIWNAIVNHQVNRRTIFVNTVTSQRIKWIEQLRQDIASFSGLTYHWCSSRVEGKPQEHEIIKELDRLRHVIRLRLNPEGKDDQKIEKLIAEIPTLTGPSNEAKLAEALEALTRATQSLLKDEWEKVKAESKRGPLSERA